MCPESDLWLLEPMEFGSIASTEGRLIVFPNVLAHRVDGFELKDKTRPGHRKTIAIFLVDPGLTILCTSHVPPQQASWIPDNDGSERQQRRQLRALGHCPYPLAVARHIQSKLMGGGRRNGRQPTKGKVPSDIVSCTPMARIVTDGVGTHKRLKYLQYLAKE
jgi:hypothetical protein